MVASRWAKISRQAHYNWLKEDPTYRPRFEEAETKFARVLEDEAIRRAHAGVRKPVFYRGKVVGYIVEHSDALMQTMLKAANPKKFRDTQSLDHRFVDAEGKDRSLDIASVRAYMRDAPEDGEK